MTNIFVRRPEISLRKKLAMSEMRRKSFEDSFVLLKNEYG